MSTARHELDFSIYLRLFLVLYRIKLFVKSRELLSIFERRSKSDRRHAEEQLETHKEKYKHCVRLSSGYV